jgi:transposase-like protein
MRGLAIVSLASTIRRINKLHYKVKSQSAEETWYDVVRRYTTGRADLRQEGQWTCSCPDFQYRKIVCKHVYAVGFSKELRRKIVSQDVSPITIKSAQIAEFSICARCKSENSVIKYGVRHNQSGDIQRYRCKNCNHKFIVNHGFEKAKASPKAVTAALDLYFKGVSLRKVCDHLKQFYGIKVSHVAVIKWIRKFVKVVKPYVDAMRPPHLSGINHVDEMMVHVRREENGVGHYSWLWNLMDDTTRFWISSMVSQRREIADARAVFKDQKAKTGMPMAVIHDGLRTYNEAFQKEYFTLKNPRVKNIRSISVRNEGLNSRVERLNGTMRDREKVMRGMHSKESAQKIIEAIRINYNFCRDHSKLGATPAEAAGIKLPIAGNRIENLIRLAARSKSENSDGYHATREL